MSPSPDAPRLMPFPARERAVDAAAPTRAEREGSRTAPPDSLMRARRTPATRPSAFHGLLKWLQRKHKIRIVAPKARRLRVTETVALGEKRFLSIVEVDGRSYLIGGAANSVALLAPLAPGTAEQPFQTVLGSAWQTKETA